MALCGSAGDEGLDDKMMCTCCGTSQTDLESHCKTTLHIDMRLQQMMNAVEKVDGVSVPLPRDMQLRCVLCDQILNGVCAALSQRWSWRICIMFVRRSTALGII